jgi:hypothetical protein
MNKIPGTKMIDYSNDKEFMKPLEDAITSDESCEIQKNYAPQFGGKRLDEDYQIFIESTETSEYKDFLNR